MRNAGRRQSTKFGLREAKRISLLLSFEEQTALAKWPRKRSNSEVAT
jgi:hypothetical protein